jgi:DNA-binding CsgD family transcriptional regulator
MRTSLESALPGHCHQRSGDLEHPWLRALDVFRIPFLCYASDGLRCHTSTAAQEFLRHSNAGQAIERQADRAVAQELGASQQGLHIGQFILARETRTPCGVLLTIHVVRPTIGDIAVIVVMRAQPHESAGGPLPGLSARETEVAQLIAAGFATKEIAFRLGISRHTARHHTERVFAKLGVRTRASVAALCSRMGASSHGRDMSSIQF